MADVINLPRTRDSDPPHCTCPKPDPLLLGLWQAIECRICRRPIRVSEPLPSTADRTYSLNEVARMFRTTPAIIKARAMAGEFPYVVNSKGHFEFPRDSLLVHLDELIKRNNRLG